jgi:tetratricopeptide (TPR) repeat protein
LHHDSTNASIWFELGSARERQKDIEGAADAFIQALRIDSQFSMAANYLGYMWAEQDMHLDSAAVYIRQALSQEPDNAAYLDSYAWVFYKMGRYDSALHYIRKSVAQLSPDHQDPVIYRHLGDILAKNARYTEALHAYERCLHLDPSDTGAIQEKIHELYQYLPENTRNEYDP